MRYALLSAAVALMPILMAPASAEAAAQDCTPASQDEMPVSAGAHMKSMDLLAPMSGQMMKDGMVMGDVARNAVKKERCMNEAIKSEEKSMDEKPK